MKKTIIYLGLALIAFANISFAANKITSENRMELPYSKNILLCLAIVKGDMDTNKKIFKYGVNLNETSNGLTPLMCAASL